ncbi:ATP-binding protein [Streptomyces sp. ODS28]|uniref:ATP-binding protein n=1 Tax=Streptomyces sp. ODS28 TaxID=3136688 RepID=UPI0031EA4F3A
MVQHGAPHEREHGNGGKDNGGSGADGAPAGGGIPNGGMAGGVSGGGVSGGGGLARAVQLLAGPYLLTVNPVDGSEIEPCPPGELPGRPEKLAPDERPEQGCAAAPTGGTPAAARPLPVLEREEECEELARLLAQGRSVRLTGPAGSGRSTLLDAVAGRVAALAPDGLVRLSGYRRTPDDLLHDLFAAVHEAPLYRPGEGELAGALQTVGAVVLVDDLEFGGEGLGRLLSATPECAFLLSATPEVPAPPADAPVAEVFLPGISRNAGLELLEHAVRRPLTDAEADWAADLWFETEGLPLRFVQAAAVLRAGGAPEGTPAQGLADAAARGLGDPAREALRYALALDGELPHHTHLPALVGDPRADEAVAELAASGLVTAADGHYRLADGVPVELATAGYAAGAAHRALTAARHYAFWAGHPSVPPERVAAESEAVLAAVRGAQRGGNPSVAVLLCRTAAPVLAAGLRWGAWERALRYGAEAAETAGEVAEEAYFRHESGVLALCEGEPGRAKGQLERALGLREALADQRGAVAGRRALALVRDLLGGTAGVRTGAGPAEEPHPATEVSPPVSPGVSQAYAETVSADESSLPPAEGAWPAGGAAEQEVAFGAEPPTRGLAVRGTRRNLIAAGAGALLAAVLGTVVTLGNMSHGGDKPAERVKPEHSASQQGGDNDLTADRPGAGSGGTGSGNDTLTGSTSRPREAPAGGYGSRTPGRDGSSSHRPPNGDAATGTGTTGGTGGSGTSGGASGGSTGGHGGGTGGANGGGTGGGSGTGGSGTGGSGSGGSGSGGSGTGGPTTGGPTTGGPTTGGPTTGGPTTGGPTTGGPTTGGPTTGGPTTGGTPTGGQTTAGTTPSSTGTLGSTPTTTTTR